MQTAAAATAAAAAAEAAAAAAVFHGQNLWATAHFHCFAHSFESNHGVVVTFPYDYGLGPQIHYVFHCFGRRSSVVAGFQSNSYALGLELVVFSITLAPVVV